MSETRVPLFAQALRGARAERGLSLAELASRLGRDPVEVGRWEAGDLPALPNLALVVALEEALDVDDDRLQLAAGYLQVRVVERLVVDVEEVTRIVQAVGDSVVERIRDLLHEDDLT